MRRLAATGLVSLGAVVSLGAAAACSHDTDLHAGADAAPEGAPGTDAGHGITVRSVAPRLTAAVAAPVSATWAAFQRDDGPWEPLAPEGEGTYAFAVPSARWAIALVCASEDDALTTVSIHHRTATTHELEITLEEQCTPAPPAAGLALTGTLSNLPPTTQWLDFGYARDSRGSVLPVLAGKASYEEVGLAPGTWDLGFGIRDDSFGALTRVFFVRATALSSDRTLDVDAAGPSSFVPGQQQLVLRGLDPSDSVTPRILYAAGGPQGIDVGPQDVPVDQQDVTLAYATVPSGAQVATDRYHGVLGAERDHRAARRTIDFSIHHAIDLDLTLPPAAPKPTVKVLGTAPQVRLETRFLALANAERHEVRVVAELNRRTQHAWQATYDAASITSAEVVDTLPDLSALAGWRAEWALPASVTASVTTTEVELASTLGDGTMQRTTANATTVTP